MTIKQLPTNKKFSHIVHVADIHIRLTKRHDEYKKVFHELFEDIYKTPPTTAIFILGDIVNSKLDLSPECVDLAAEFLRDAADLRPTVLILGNHDTNLANRNRLDSLSPIVDALNHPNLFYLKDSGLYGFGNICINNYSVFDTPDKYLKGMDIPKIYRNQYEYFIATYHGQVDGAMTDIGFKLINPTVTIDMFDNHDIVLMGDIHKHQDLQVYDDRIKPAIRYCGSLIQQKHDEPLQGHGYSFWNLERREYSHIDVPNNYGFFSVLVENGVITTDLKDIPKKSRIRFQLKNSSPSEVKSALVTIRQLTEVVETSYQKLDLNTSLTRIPTTTGTVVLGNINDKNYQTVLIIDYLKNKLHVTDESFIESVININNDINNVVKKDDFARNIRWKPIKFEWENMFSYGEDNVIDFTKAKDIIGIFAANTSGKSSIFSALTFCLFDKCEREFKACNIINTQKTTFSCKFEFEIDNIRYFIKRTADTDKKGKVKVDVEFWKIENGKKEDLNGEQRKNTNEIIREYLGSYEDFVLTSLSVQNGKNNASIIDMGDTDRKDLFAQFMGLNVFDRLYEVGNERMKERLVKLKTYRNDDYTKKLIDYETLQGQAEHLYNSENEILLEIGKKKDLIQQNILEETKKLIKIEGKIPSLEDSQRAVLRARLGVDNTKNDIKSKETDIELLSGQLTPIELEIKELEDKNVEETSKKYQELLTKKTNIENKREQLKIKYKHNMEICVKDENIEYDSNCKFCVKHVGTIAEEVSKAKRQIYDMQIIASDLLQEMDSVDIQISENKWAYDANLKFTSLLSKRNKLTNDKMRLTNSINSLKRDLSVYEDEVKTHDKNIELYNKNSESIIFNEGINKQIDEYNTEFSQVSYLYKTKNKTLMDINSKISVCKNQISEINEKIEKIKVVEQEYKVYDAYCKAVNRDGIPFDVITATVPEIQNEVNSILSQTCEFTALFETDGNDIIPYIVYDGRKWLMSLTSGFEKFTLSLAIRVSLINISNLPKPNFLILDEGFGVLDAENLSLMSSLFSYLKTNFDFIMIISHLDVLRDFVDKHIEIKKENGFSKVNFV